MLYKAHKRQLLLLGYKNFMKVVRLKKKKLVDCS